MAKDASPGGKKSGALVPLILLTLIAAGAGAAHGLQTFKVVQGAPPAAEGAAAPAKAEPPAAKPEGHGAKAEGHGAKADGHGAKAEGHGAPAAEHGAPAKDAKAEPVKLPSRIVIRDIPPVVTNVAMPSESWVRLEASIIYDQADIAEPTVMAGEISGDLMAFLRSVSLREMQGPEGLMYLRQDLKERVKTRSEGKVRDIIIQTLVVQ